MLEEFHLLEKVEVEPAGFYQHIMTRHVETQISKYFLAFVEKKNGLKVCVNIVCGESQNTELRTIRSSFINDL